MHDRLWRRASGHVGRQAAGQLVRTHRHLVFRTARRHSRLRLRPQGPGHAAAEALE